MKLLVTLVLVLALSASTYAGNMQNGIVPPPPQPAQEQSAITTESTETPETTEQTPTVTQIILTVADVLGLI